jgi:Peptidase propeptide and YPEB domain
LRSLGSSSWKEIELDDGHWEIDDARHSDGKKYDLELHLETLSILKQKECF